jgi:hypothetical protein
MTVKQQAENLIDEAYQFAPSSGGTKESIAISIAIWHVDGILSALPGNKYWIDVIEYLEAKIKP